MLHTWCMWVIDMSVSAVSQYACTRVVLPECMYSSVSHTYSTFASEFLCLIFVPCIILVLLCICYLTCMHSITSNKIQRISDTFSCAICCMVISTPACICQQQAYYIDSSMIVPVTTSSVKMWRVPRVTHFRLLTNISMSCDIHTNT